MQISIEEIQLGRAQQLISQAQGLDIKYFTFMTTTKKRWLPWQNDVVTSRASATATTAVDSWFYYHIAAGKLTIILLNRNQCECGVNLSNSTMGSSTDLRYELSQNAYIKLVLHSLKHPTSPVNGVLIGRISPSNDTVQIDDAVPLFHSHLGLLPQLEISLILVRTHPLSIFFSRVLCIFFFRFAIQFWPNMVTYEILYEKTCFLEEHVK